MSQLTISPIRLTTEEVFAIIAQRKKMLRKTIKHKISYEANDPTRKDLDAFGVLNKEGNYIEVEEGMPATLKDCDFCPYRKGTVLWVKEKFLPGNPALTDNNSMYWTFADGDQLFSSGEYAVSPVKAKSSNSWKAPNYLPVEAARIWLEVTDICVERLQNISEEDAVREGVDFRNYMFSGLQCNTARDSFMTFWDSIKGLNAWEKNPWVWVVSFNVLSVTGKPKHITISKNEQVAINVN